MSDVLGPPTTGSPSHGRRPRGVLRIDGAIIQALCFEVTNRAHFAADRWSADLEPWQQPQGYGLGFWAQAGTGQRVELLIGELDDSQDVSEPPDDIFSLIIGQVDDVHIEAIGGSQRLRLTGRDLSALLIDTKTSNKWPDQTSSQIVTMLANQVGLTPQVTPTDTPVGQFYKDSYVGVRRETPMYDLIAFLAQQEGFDFLIMGTTLYFGPPLAQSDPNPFTVTVTQDPGSGQIWAQNATRLELRRSLVLSGDVTVTVISHGAGKGKSIKAVANRAGTRAPSSAASKGAERVQNYVIRRPNLTQEQAQQLANSMLADLTQHERTIEVTAEGDPTVNVTRRARLAGTGTSFDADYYIHSVRHEWSWERGYCMDIHALTLPPTSEEAAL